MFSIVGARERPACGHDALQFGEALIRVAPVIPPSQPRTSRPGLLVPQFYLDLTTERAGSPTFLGVLKFDSVEAGRGGSIKIPTGRTLTGVTAGRPVSPRLQPLPTRRVAGATLPAGARSLGAGELWNGRLDLPAAVNSPAGARSRPRVLRFPGSVADAS